VSGVLGALIALGGPIGTPTLTDRTVSATAAGANSTANVSFQGSTGALVTEATGTDAGTGRAPEWSGFSSSVNCGAYWEIRLTVSSGSSPTGSAVDSWISLSSNASWTLFRNSSTQGAGTSSGVWLVEIRGATDHVVRDSASYTMSATVT
jgi:hypothetical protein